MISGRTYFADEEGNIINLQGRKLKIDFSPAKHNSPYTHGGAYPCVKIAGRNPLVHKLVCAAFWGMPAPDQVCHHLDGNKFNNRPDNLVWVHVKDHPAWDRAMRAGQIFKHTAPKED